MVRENVSDEIALKLSQTCTQIAVRAMKLHSNHLLSDEIALKSPHENWNWLVSDEIALKLSQTCTQIAVCERNCTQIELCCTQIACLVMKLYSNCRILKSSH